MALGSLIAMVRCLVAQNLNLKLRLLVRRRYNISACTLTMDNLYIFESGWKRSLSRS